MPLNSFGMHGSRKVARVLVCGLGRMGRLRVQGVLAHPELELAGVADNDFAKSSAVAEEAGCRAYVPVPCFGTTQACSHSVVMVLGWGAVYRYADVGDALVVAEHMFDAVIVSCPTSKRMEAAKLGMAPTCVLPMHP